MPKTSQIRQIVGMAMRQAQAAEAWIRKQLEADGIIFQELPPEVSFDFKGW